MTGQPATATSSVYEIPLTALSGEPLDPSLLRGRATLIVNVASRCGLTPQYAGLQRLYERYRDRGLVVLGAPCDQFGGQEPGTAEEIVDFCSSNYQVTFPLTEKLEVNGHDRHPLYTALRSQPDDSGIAGDVQWNFEKFLVSPHGTPLARFRRPRRPMPKRSSRRSKRPSPAGRSRNGRQHWGAPSPAATGSASPPASS
jgi:glutathione peroxidase